MSLELGVAVHNRSGAWLEDPGFGVYVHIPFCLHRCLYCDFNTYEDLDALHGPYVDALEREIVGSPQSPPATSVFFGGGTPTLLPPTALARILAAIRSHIGMEEGAEVTVEANPETVDARAFEALLAAGVNRFSIGVQSLEPGVLERLGRRHSTAAAIAAVRAARSAGVEDLNIDLIYGSPWETTSAWDHTLARAIELEPDHVSAYALTVESGTPLAVLVATGREADVDPDVQAERYERAGRALAAAGYARYEISNWTRPGRASRHNVLYWSAGDYIGLGAGAHSHRAGRRSWRVRLPREYVARVTSGEVTEAGIELLEPADRSAEAVMLGLRLVSGIDRAGFERRFGRDPIEGREQAASRLAGAGALVVGPETVALSPAGFFLANEVISGLI